MIYSDNKDFYPTPEALLRRLLSGKRFLDGLILEPSAGKGDMVFAYTRFNLEAMRLMSPLEIKQLKTAEAVRFNGSGYKPYDLDLPSITNISEAVYKYAIGGKTAV